MKLIKHLAAPIFLILLGGILLYNLGYYRVPALDFFYFPIEGRSYLAFQLPDVIQDPPMYSMLLVLVSFFLPVQYPEMVAGIAINIVCFLLGLFLLWKVGATWLGKWGILLVALVATNPLSYYLALQPMNSMLFFLVVLLVLYLRQQGYRRASFLVAGASYLIRYEGIALLCAMAAVDFFQKKDRRKTLVWFFVSILPAVIWEFIVYIHNPTSNLYLQELVGRVRQLPNWGFIVHAFVQAPFIGLPSWVALGLGVIGGMGVIWGIRERRGIREICEKREIGWFVALYTILHMAFPADATRYPFPILWAVYGSLIWVFTQLVPKKWHWALVLLVVGITAGNMMVIRPYLLAEKFVGEELRAEGEWLSAQQFVRPTLVVASHPRVVSYFTNNPKVVFFDFFRYRCGDVACAIDVYKKEQDFDVLIVTDTAREDPLAVKYSSSYEKPALDNLVRLHAERLNLFISFPVRDQRVSVYHYEKK